jgi:hypothetical protein
MHARRGEQHSATATCLENCLRYGLQPGCASVLPAVSAPGKVRRCCYVRPLRPAAAISATTCVCTKFYDASRVLRRRHVGSAPRESARAAPRRRARQLNPVLNPRGCCRHGAPRQHFTTGHAAPLIGSSYRAATPAWVAARGDGRVLCAAAGTGGRRCWSVRVMRCPVTRRVRA